MIQKPMLGQLPDWTRFFPPHCLGAANEGSGTRVNDLSGNRNHGTLSGAYSWIDNGIHFATGANLNFGSETDRIHNTYIIWVRGAAFGDLNYFYRQVGVSRLRFQSATTVRFYQYVGTNLNYADASIAVQDGKWHQIAVTWDGVLLKLYHNGVFIASTGTYPGDGDLNTNDLIIASDSDFAGDIGSFVVFPFALTAGQIAYLFQNSWPWFVEDPISHLYVPGAPPAVIASPYYYEHLMQGAA